MCFVSDVKVQVRLRLITCVWSLDNGQMAADGPYSESWIVRATKKSSVMGTYPDRVVVLDAAGQHDSQSSWTNHAASEEHSRRDMAKDDMTFLDTQRIVNGPPVKRVITCGVRSEKNARLCVRWSYACTAAASFLAHAWLRDFQGTRKICLEQLIQSMVYIYIYISSTTGSPAAQQRINMPKCLS